MHVQGAAVTGVAVTRLTVYYLNSEIYTTAFF